MRIVAAIAACCTVVFVAGPASVQAAVGTGDREDVELVSSVMWQPSAHGPSYIYPPGIPAVLKRGDADRTLRIEQYFEASEPLPASALIPRVSGTWPRIARNELQRDPRTQGWKNDFVTITRPECDAERSATGYRCAIDLAFSAATPTGTIGVSIGVQVGSVEFTHPNSIFWIILPEQGTNRLDSDGDEKVYGHAATALGLIPAGSPRTAAFERSLAAPPGEMELTEVRKHVVRITLGHGSDEAGEGVGFIMGSGFIARDVEPLRKLFKPSVFEASAAIPGPAVYVVTAAHLFPVAYSYGALGDPFQPTEGGSQPFRSSFYYDIHIDGIPLSQAAVLLGRNVESDVALLRIRPASLPRLARALGASSIEAIRGLAISDSIDSEDGSSPFIILGYPAVDEGRMVQRIGKLVRGEYPTDDTSNFGPLSKLKLEAMDPSSTGCAGGDPVERCALAEPGMSGGPIVDADGRVVGLTVERPNDTNSLIALDLTSIARLPRGFALDDQRCMLRFNPFDRILTLVNRDSGCDYGHFGSPRTFPLLTGEWTIQEVLGFDDDKAAVDGDDARLARVPGDALYSKAVRGETLYHFTNGHSIINGHAIINGHTIINGHAIIRKVVLIVNRENLEQINEEQIAAGFRLNPDSFRSFVPKGIRILQVSDVSDLPDAGALGRLVVGTRESLDDHGVTPVYSIRDFVIWLHNAVHNPQYRQLMCLDGNLVCQPL